MCENSCGAGGEVEFLSAKDWDSRYLEGRTGWDRGCPNPQLLVWCDDLPDERLSILIPGCGRGYELVAFAQRGHHVTGVDFAESAIAAARKHGATAGVSIRLLQQDLFVYTPEESYDVVYEQTCLCAIHPSRWQAYERLLYSWLKPQGKLLAHFMQSDKPNGPPFHCDLGSMRALFAEDRWVWKSVGTKARHPMGMDEIPCLLERRMGS